MSCLCQLRARRLVLGRNRLGIQWSAKTVATLMAQSDILELHFGHAMNKTRLVQFSRACANGLTVPKLVMESSLGLETQSLLWRISRIWNVRELTLEFDIWNILVDKSLNGHIQWNGLLRKLILSSSSTFSGPPVFSEGLLKKFQVKDRLVELVLYDGTEGEQPAFDPVWRDLAMTCMTIHQKTLLLRSLFKNPPADEESESVRVLRVFLALPSTNTAVFYQLLLDNEWGMFLILPELVTFQPLTHTLYSGRDIVSGGCACHIS
jgi:hypothetical protein